MHTCQYPVNADELCGQPAHGCIESDEGESRQWFCAEHYDYIANLFKRIAEEDVEWAAVFAHLIKRNRL